MKKRQRKSRARRSYQPALCQNLRVRARQSPRQGAPARAASGNTARTALLRSGFADNSTALRAVAPVPRRATSGATTNRAAATAPRTPKFCPNYYARGEYARIGVSASNWKYQVQQMSILISEIFGPTIQGEGALIGRPTVFVRTGGCDFRCQWCDTLYAVLPQHKASWRRMDAPTIVAEVERLSGGAPITVTVSGGNPALQPLGELLELGHARGHRFALETQGTRAPRMVERVRSSGFVAQTAVVGHGVFCSSSWPIASKRRARSRNRLKSWFSTKPIFSSRAAFTRCIPMCRFICRSAIRRRKRGRRADNAALTRQLEWILERCAQEKWFDVTLTPQLHVMLWGNKRGV